METELYPIVKSHTEAACTSSIMDRSSTSVVERIYHPFLALKSSLLAFKADTPPPLYGRTPEQEHHHFDLFDYNFQLLLILKTFSLMFNHSLPLT